MNLPFLADKDAPAVPIHALRTGEWRTWIERHSDTLQRMAAAHDFQAQNGRILLVPATDGAIERVLFGVGDKANAMAIGALAQHLPAGDYRLTFTPHEFAPTAVAVAWGLGAYAFDRYKPRKRPAPRLAPPDGADMAEAGRIIEASWLARDLVNTPTNDMGPEALHAAAQKVASECGARFEAVVGDELLTQNYPLIHAVGRAAKQAPRLLHLSWGDVKAPRVAIVGKGVCFDTGGLNLKPGASMGLMKKDMGGAANVLGLARMLMASDAALRLRVLIPAVENSVSGASFRPGDILTSRKGLTVEINNTDAEGRLVLADALALADEADPDLIVSMATLTGAARVAVGPDLAPFYTDRDADAAALEAAARAVRDPVWRMPFWDPYDAMIEPGIADLDNAPSGGHAGSITAALFLRRFVSDTRRYMHFDIFGWTPKAEPGRPKGGAGQGIRALFEALPGMVG